MNATERAGLVSQGLDFHRRGELEQAGRCYADVLEDDPMSAEALHLFGIILHQLGDSRAAVGAIERSAAIRPNRWHVHSNLGEVYRSLGQVDRAQACRFLGWKLRPDGNQPPVDFDILIHADGILGAVAPPPPRARSAVSAASIEAIETGRRLKAEGNLTEARRFFEASTRIEPGLADGWNELGEIDREQGRFIESRSSFLESLRLAPDQVETLNSMGRNLVESREPKQALAWFRLALDLEPASVAIRANLAWSLREIGEVDEAFVLARQILAEAPGASEAHLCLGAILHDKREFEEASQAFEQAIFLNPSSILARRSRAILRAELGDFEGSEADYREVLRLSPAQSRAHLGLANIHKGRLKEPDVDRIRMALDRPDLLLADRAELLFALGAVHDARGDFAEAAQALAEANALRLRENALLGRFYQRAEHETFVERMIEICSRDFFENLAESGSPSNRPVFIVGLPRSGTSLTEQILASHSRVQGLGETEAVPGSFDRLPTLMSPHSSALDCFARLDRETIRTLAESHLKRLDAAAGSGSLVVDKLPDNYLFLGFLAVLFPNAKFIHCRRDLRDTAVSLWSNNFRYLDWPNSFETIASRFTMYQRLMTHWDDVLPSPLLNLDYEATVDDLETSARTLLDWCELDWEPACLDFHKSTRPVRTASFAQVRQPIYRGSLERWRNYEAALGPLFERIDAGVKV